ncbi:receptor-transporting protein 4-like [Pollicipes pollicipes]|uniref:receptor-transporting protein 4-like n=1 Tax=Pollicipes pollicipes TaxID=41117 RepID=UPI00188538CB|nr:receptor-transporting protein 4-like [Pollicipes pollicipes]
MSDNGLVAVHVRHESYTVEPAFPGPICVLYVKDPAGVLHVCVPIQEFGSQVEYGMYVVWVTSFAELFNQTGHHWALVPQPPSTPKPDRIWRCYSTSAKIRFRCDRCGNKWTSIHGQVSFQYFLRKGSGAGTVFFQLFGQKCSVCVRQRLRERVSATATTAVLLELYVQVTSKLYPDLPRVVPPSGQQRRFGQPQQQHDLSLCQGCAAGICRMKRRGRRVVRK